MSGNSHLARIDSEALQGIASQRRNAMPKLKARMLILSQDRLADLKYQRRMTRCCIEIPKSNIINQ